MVPRPQKSIDVLKEDLLLHSKPLILDFGIILNKKNI